MNTVDVVPLDWLRDLLANHPDVKSVEVALDGRDLLVLTVGGTRLRFRVGHGTANYQGALRL